MAVQKACKQCRAIYSGTKCPKCGYQEGSEGFKGRVEVLNTQESEVAKNLGIKDKGSYAIRLG